jgi:hypothetical protein
VELGGGARANNIIYKIRKRLRPCRGEVIHTDKYLDRLEEEEEVF